MFHVPAQTSLKLIKRKKKKLSLIFFFGEKKEKEADHKYFDMMIYRYIRLYTLISNIWIWNIDK